MKSLHLFAGVGGGILADKILGNTIVGAVEIDSFCRDVLRARQTEGLLESFPIFEDVRTFSGDEIDGEIDIVCGGFPCQDISTAGKGAGIEGKKSSLFRELLRVCNRIRPRYIFLENVQTITFRGLDTVLREIAEIGYNAEWGTLSAGELGAPHKRARWWCVCKRADADPRRDAECLRARFQQLRETPPFGIRDCTVSRATRDSANTEGFGRCKQGAKHRGNGSSIGAGAVESCTNVPDVLGWWEIEPGLGRVANGVPNRVDRIKALGNAQVPICAAIAFYLLLERYCCDEEYCNGD